MSASLRHSLPCCAHSTDFGSGEWIGIVLFALVLFFGMETMGPSLVTLIVAVPGGMLLNEWVKLLVHRQRPFLDGPFVDWSWLQFWPVVTPSEPLFFTGSSCFLFCPLSKGVTGVLLSILSAISLVAVVGFSRIALGATFSNRCSRGRLFGIIWLTFCLFCHEVSAATHGFNYWLASYQRTCSGARRIGRKPAQSLPS
jgi:hypothetical protein